MKSFKQRLPKIEYIYSQKLAFEHAKSIIYTDLLEGSSSIVLQYYCKVLQYFGIATSQSIAISIAMVIAKFSSIAKSIAKFFKHFKKHCKKSKYCKKYCKIPKYCEK